MAKVESKQLNDLLSAFPYGMNSGVDPILLPKQQAAFALNTTFRGGYATDRPPLRKLTLDFQGSTTLRDAVRYGLFQGASVYRPDFGDSQIIVQISGRLFSITESGTSWLVKEITIAGDPNDATAAQVWMWQSEKWLIISDGSIKNPIFYDGTSCRRSLGAAQVLATSAAPATAPAVGATVDVTLTSPYTGPLNIIVEFNGFRYQVVGTGVGASLNQVLLTGFYSSPFSGAIGQAVSVETNVAGYASGEQHYPARPGPHTFTIQMDSVASIVVGDSINFKVFTPANNGVVYSLPIVTAVDYVLNKIQVTVPVLINQYVNFAQVLADKTPIPFVPARGTSQLIGYLQTPFNAASTAPQTITLDRLYSGPEDVIVTVAVNANAKINTIPSVPSTTLTLLNITDTSAGVIPGGTAISSLSEIPPCRMGAYGLGQNWFSSTDGLSFGPSDLVGSSSGTPGYDYRDAVLHTTDLDVMGMFKIPVAGEIITAMRFVATLDQALGQGPLQIGVPSGMFSCKAPFTLQDFQGITNAVTGDLVTAPILDPILTKSLVGFGPVAQNSTVLANSDTIFRSFEGINSLILARRNFSDIGGNTPISREMTRIIDRDNKSLLSYSSAIVFDNRLRMTCSPQVSAQGVFHMGELVLNYDLISSLRGKASPVWDGVWTGTNVFQFIQGLFGPTSRAFSFTFNISESQIELYELLPSGIEFFDNGNTLIKWVVETPVIFNSDVKNLVDVARLIDGEMYLSDVIWQVNVVVKYRPLFYSCWRPWHTYSVCADMSNETSQDQVRYALGLGEPDPKDCDAINDQPFREGNGFQLRFEIEGHCKLWGAAFRGEQVPIPAFNKPAGTCTNAAPICLSNICTVPDDLETYSLDGLPATPLPSIRIIPRTPPVPAPTPPEPVVPPVVPPPTPKPFTNDPVYYPVDCPAGTTLTFTP